MRKNLIARGKRLYLVVPEGDTKNNEPVDFELPAETVDIVAWYIRDYRPHLVRAPTDALFPGEGSGPKAAYGLGPQIKAADDLALPLNAAPHSDHAGAHHDAAKLLECLRPNHQVGDPGLVLQGDKHHAFGAAGPLSDEHEPRRLEPTPVARVHSLGAGDNATRGKIVTQERDGVPKVRGLMRGSIDICARLSIWNVPSVSALRIIA